MDLPLKLALARMANGISPASVNMALADWWTHFAKSPSLQAELAVDAVRKAALFGQYLMQSWHGDGAPGVDAGPPDKRFAQPGWERPPFNAMAQAFLLQAKWWDQATHGVRGVSEHHEDLVNFMTRQWLDVWSPSNFIATNPQVLRQTFITGGMNLATGYANWARDAVAVASDGRPRGVEDFLPGKAVALTPGKVVLRNRLIELIQYEPATPRVGAQPVLVIPSWIMKYYILDLTPQDSLAKYLVSQGHTVFMVSWKNPLGDDRDLGMEDYLELGPFAAVREVQSRFPKQGIHAMGYCLGGTLLSIAAALYGAKPNNPLRTLTLLAAETDFKEPGQLGLFIDESQIAFLEDLMSERGYLDGRQMAGAFALINSKDLVWSKLVHEYLMGAQTPMTALRAWNADATRLPARMHSEYLRSLYLHNDLAEGRFRVHGKAVTLADIKVPMFVVGTEWDHVSPWPSVYKVCRLVRAPVTFALTSRGHNVGIVNPPGSEGGNYYRIAAHAAGRSPADPQEWLKSATRHESSWWPAWDGWLRNHTTAQLKATPVRGLVEGGSPVLAPGTYVHQR